MIRLAKAPKPDILEEHEKEWTERFVEHCTQGTPISNADRYRYRNPAIKEAIATETHHKCAYCESKVTDVYPGDCEHIIPKTARPDLFVTWENLTFACANCNRFKGDYHSETEPLLNPYEEDPDNHLIFLGPMVSHRLHSQLGMRTVSRLRLQRAALVERRQERLRAMIDLIDKWASLAPGPTKDIIRDEIVAEYGPDKEYSAAVRALVQDRVGL